MDHQGKQKSRPQWAHSSGFHSRTIIAVRDETPLGSFRYYHLDRVLLYGVFPVLEGFKLGYKGSRFVGARTPS